MNKGCATFAASNGYAKENVDGKAAPRVDNKATQIRKRNLPRVKHSEKITLKKLLKKFLFFVYLFLHLEKKKNSHLYLIDYEPVRLTHVVDIIAV